MEELNFDDLEHLMNNFHRLNKAAHYMMCQKTKNYVISPDQTRLLFILKKHQNINQKNLAKCLNVTKATLSVRIQRLEKMGYLVRNQDSSDKRNYILNITKAGEQFIDEAISIMKDNLVKMFKGVTEEQIAVISDVLDILIKNVEACKGEQ